MAHHEPETHFLLRKFIPRWAFALILIVTLPFALWFGITFGMSWEKNLFPTASVRCQ